MIPKIIHYCWLSNDPIPENLKSCISTWEDKLSDYKFIKWDFNRFEKESSRWVSEAFDNKKYAFACDYIRLYAVYHYGGIYLDMDVEVIKSFDSLLDKEYMFAFEGKAGKGIEAGCFGAEKGNLFIENCLRYYTNRGFVKEDGSFDTIPLPQIMQKIMDDKKIKYEIYSHDFFTAKSFNTGVVTKTDDTFAVHHFAGSWKDDAEKKRIERLQYLSKKYGWFGKNYAELEAAYQDYGLQGTLDLLKRKIKNKFLRG